MEKQPLPITVTEYAAGPLFETQPPFGSTEGVAYAQLIRVLTTNPNVVIITEEHGKVVEKPWVIETTEKRVLY